MAKYAIGIDFGTLSGRAAVVSLADGTELAHSVLDYPHAVMDERLPSGRVLPPDWALQHPADYLDVLKTTIPDAVKKAGVEIADIIGLAIDFTACTMLPVKADGTPLCMVPGLEDEPHAYIKLWKHHAAQDEANRLNAIAEERGETWLSRYGGKISSEWMIPKIWQILNEAPEIYDQADFFLEAADWVIWQLTGVQTRNSCTAGYKALWHKQNGYPGKDFFRALDPRMENLIEDKMNCPISPLGSRAGEITEKSAALTGLLPGTAVAVANVDAHVAVPAVKIDGPGKMLAIMGTSTCHMVLGEGEHSVPGICGYVEDGILPGFFGYEAGQSCVGDHFAWFVENCVPASYFEEAKKAGLNIHQYLASKATLLKPGQSGLVALDWWNGNRSILVDVDLTGMMLGMTLQTKPEEMYRALIEATAYGTRVVVDNYRKNEVPIKRVLACGGIAQKDPMMMQIYADVLNLPVYIAGTKQCGALGSAIMASVAAGSERGGYDNVFEAAQHMGKLKDEYYRPNPENVALYNKLYAEYKTLHDYFGRGANDVMKRLKQLKLSLYNE